MSRLKNALIGLAAGVFFVLLYAAGVMGFLEERTYDIFLRGRPNRERIKQVAFLDVDDEAIAYNGVFPWPRSAMADGFLRLKEYGVLAVILDIEFIDKGPEGIDSVYLDRDFPLEFERTFYYLGANVSDLLASLRAGWIGAEEAELYEGELLSMIQDEKTELFQKTLGIVRDNDLYLAQASALFGRTWATLNLRDDFLSGEQAERRPLAEQKFSYPVDLAPGASGTPYIDILPAIPSFAEAARGAGFTNVHVDEDGVRRRIFLVHRVGDHWYLQLAFAPLMEYLDYPQIRLEKRRLVLKDARLPGGEIRDISIPLDSGGRMLLDWPETDFQDSFKPHISFAEFSRLEALEAQIERYLAELETSNLPYFARFDAGLSPVPGLIYEINLLLGEARDARTLALAERSDAAFERSLEYRSRAMDMIRSLDAGELAASLRPLAAALGREYPEDAEDIRQEADYIARLAEYLDLAREQYQAAQSWLRENLEGKFCIIGRVDTGTTDIGVNPFFGKYVNVGTHAVVLDTILRESFIRPLSPLWSAACCLVLAILLMLVLKDLKPALRAGLGAGAALLFALLSFAVFRFTGVFIGPLGPVLAALAAVIIRELVSYVVSEKEKRFINRALSTYVSKEVVDELVANPSLLQLGGSKRRMSAVFTDIQSFSTISEQLDPEHLVLLLNRYLTAMSDIIMENMGTIDKYEGDAIMAFFGAPVYREDHASRACRSAIGMKKVERALNRELIDQGLITGGVIEVLKNDEAVPVPLYTRIGINTGDMVVGNMGTYNKMNYTVMGNAVNLAARLEGINKQYRTGGIAISEYTRNEIGDEFICRSLDRVRVVGINAPVKLYELLGLRNEAGAAELEALDHWERARALYEGRQFGAAGKIFSLLAVRDGEEDGPARYFVNQCRDFIAHPPPPDWDGINNLTQK